MPLQLHAKKQKSSMRLFVIEKKLISGQFLSKYSCARLFLERSYESISSLYVAATSQRKSEKFKALGFHKT